MKSAATATVRGFAPSLMEAARVLRMGTLSLGEWLRSEAAKNPCLRPGRLPPPPMDGEGLRESLRAQCLASFAPGAVREMTDSLILSLDDDGYLQPDEEERAFLIGRSGLSGAAGEELYGRGLALLQSLDPAGAGARDLGDSLRLQLLRLPDSEARAAALVLTGEDKLRWVLRRRYDRLPRKNLAAAMALLEKLHSSPARAAAPADREAPADLRFSLLRGLWKALPAEEGGLPSAENCGSPDEWRRAKRVVSLVSSRRRRLLEAAQFAADRQSDFFRRGVSGLRALALGEAAESLGVSNAMMSHIVCDKRFLASGGVFALELLFPRPVCGRQAARAVFEMMREMIADEDPAHPLGDSALRVALRERGADIARRTVAHYRRRAGIPPASMRKPVPGGVECR